MIATTVITMANDMAGGHVGAAAVKLVVAVVVAWLVSQGIADHGAQGADRVNKAWYQSRKLWTMVATVIVIVANDLGGQPADFATLQLAVGGICAWIVGQGVADHGAQGKFFTASRRSVRPEHNTPPVQSSR